MAQLKTSPTGQDVHAFIEEVENDQKRKDSKTLLELMERITGEKPAMWGPSIIGFGSYHYRYDSGREGDWFLTGFSPRKRNLSLYIMSGFSRYDELLKQLGKHKTGKSCLYINKLEDVDMQVLEQLIKDSVDNIKRTRETNTQ